MKPKDVPFLATTVIALEILTCTATNYTLQRDGRQSRATLHRVEKLLCRQQAVGAKGWQGRRYTAWSCSYGLCSNPRERGVPWECITDTSGELLSQGCGGQHAQCLLSRDMGLMRGDSWVLHNNCLLFHTPSRALEPMTGQTSADLCQGLNKSQAAVSSKVSLQLYAKTWMQVCSVLLLQSTLTHFSGGRKPSQNNTKNIKQVRRKVLHVAYKATNCKMEVLHAVTSWLVQSVKLGAVDSNAI